MMSGIGRPLRPLRKVILKVICQPLLGIHVFGESCLLDLSVEASRNPWAGNSFFRCGHIHTVHDGH